MRRKILTNDNRAVEVLRIPYYYQSNSDWLCFVFSLKMCLEYFKNIYQNTVVRNNTPNLNIDNIKALTHSREFTGTRVDRSLMNELSREIPPIEFSLNEECSIDTLIDNFKKNLPTIVLYNCSYVLYEEAGPGHAGVVIGIVEDNDLILNNPWLGPEKLVKWKDFLKGWELEYNRVVVMKPKTQTRLVVE
mgnify:CR=1 FL=1